MIRGLLDRPAPVARMGREKKILLGLLGLLAGVFVGVLSIKLLVPRPPTGAGPDIRTDIADTTAQERVEPPAPSPGGWDFAAAPPLVQDPPAPAPESPPPVTEPRRASRFAAAAAGDPPAIDDTAVAPASWQRTTDPPTASDLALPEETEPAPRFAAQTAGGVEADGPAPDPFTHRPAAAPDPPVVPAAALRAAPVAGDYLVQAGDSWWNVAERAYGDGRCYRALFAWNRSRDPRVSLAPGTRLDVPPLVRLQAAWPRLLPAAAAP